MFSFSSGEDRHLIVFDLEWNQNSYVPNHRMPHEIIEIGACRVNRNYEIVDTFSALIKPKLYRRLDKHIKSVTGITESELAAGGTFSDVFADFIRWCGEDSLLVTWGRDDYPVLKRNAAFFMTTMPFSPPVDAQFIFAGAVLGDVHKQMNLHAALEKMEINPDVPAHRAVYDAECTAALLRTIDEAVAALEPAQRQRLDALLVREQRIAASILRSQPTQHVFQTDALMDLTLMSIACPSCGAATGFDTKWFDGGKEKYLAISTCAKHGPIYGQMHFKRVQNGTLLMHQRTMLATQEEVESVREGYRLYQLTPVKKRHHRLSMEDARERKAEYQSAAERRKQGAPDRQG
ncbi:MAG: exonuclease domain-containing protein [Clostridia bacterium]|nr:exonuclease domain-containing protein [Clostridia bacterium]